MTEFNAADRKHVRRAEKAAKLADAQRREIITQVMGTIAGRSWVLDHLNAGHIFATSFTGDALTSAFSEGQRNMGLRLLNDIMQACPDLYVLMMRESNERSTAAEQSRSTKPDGGDSATEGRDAESFPEPGDTTES